jgi:hypothetical protein
MVPGRVIIAVEPAIGLAKVRRVDKEEYRTRTGCWLSQELDGIKASDTKPISLLRDRLDPLDEIPFVEAR